MLDRFLLWIDFVWHEKPVKMQNRLISFATLFLCSGLSCLILSAMTGIFASLFICASGILMLFGFALFGCGAAVYFTRVPKGSQGTAHFAQLADISHAGLSAPSGLELGVYHGQIIAVTEQQQESHVLLVAPTGKGKTSGIIIPGLLQENGQRSLVINDVKGELISTCAGALAAHSTVKIFSPTKPQHSQYYNPLAHVRSVEDAEDLADCWIQNTGTSQHDPFWDRAASVLITAVILHLTQGAATLYPLSAIADILTGMTIDQIQQVLLQSPSILARRSITTFMNSVSNNAKLGGSIMLEVSSRFRLLNNPAIRTVTQEDEFDFDSLIDEASAWFLSIPASDAKRLKPVSACFYMQMMKRLTQRAEASPGGRLPFPIAFYLDEFVNAGRIMHFEEHISLVRSAGIAFLLALQDFGQLKREYGEDIADTILANCTTHVVFPGTGQKECEFYSDRVGESTAYSQSVGYNIASGFSLNTSETRRRLMHPDEIRTMPQGALLLLHSNTPPVIVQNVPYFQRPELLARVGLPFHASIRPPQPPPPPLLSPPPAGTPSQQAPGAASQSTLWNDPFSLP